MSQPTQNPWFYDFNHDELRRRVTVERAGKPSALLLRVSQEALEDVFGRGIRTKLEIRSTMKQAWPRIRRAAETALRNGQGHNSREIMITSRMLEAVR